MTFTKKLIAKSILQVVGAMGFGLIIAACYGAYYDDDYLHYCDNHEQCPQGMTCGDEGVCVYPSTEDAGNADADVEESLETGVQNEQVEE